MAKRSRRQRQHGARRHNHLGDYPTPANLSYHWGYGSIAGLMRVVQLVTGVRRAIHYVPHTDRAFGSVEHVIRDVIGGWVVRYRHANGASCFFGVVNLHRLRGLYYGSYVGSRVYRWSSGVVRYLRLMGTGFMGYVLPFGQISLWGATVITSLASAVPRVGQERVYWLWGGYSVDQATLNRFYAIHYLRPFVVAGLSLVHRVLLHSEGVGSGNPLGVDGDRDRTRFYPYFYVKDLVGLLGLWLRFSVLVFFTPNRLGHPDNYLYANPRVTPNHIVPEWYFRTYYGILRSIPHKLGGVVAMRSAIRGLLTRPRSSTSEVRSTTFRPRFMVALNRFVVVGLRLGWVGQKVVSYPYVELGHYGTRYYFGFMIVLVPVLGRRESLAMRTAEEVQSKH